ncbi:MAG TPA: hypothetical protein VNM48_02320 [Chloroflexota bacterium]|nr:hypothetical protein [Chloroflexota bacterium]
MTASEAEAADSDYRQTLTALLSAQRKLRRIEAILQGMRWNGRGLNDPYANWIRGQLELALEPEAEKEAT